MDSINLSVLQRQDPKITKILDSATQVAIYAFNAATSEWEKTESEGALFICERSTQPPYVLMIMNRLSRDNYTEPIVPGLDLCPNNQYLLYKSSDRIRCIWFYNLEDCAKIGGLIHKLLESYALSVHKQPVSVEPKKISPVVQHQQQLQPTSAISNNKTPDIVSMLNRAHHQYDQSVQRTSRHKSVNDEIAAPLTALLSSANKNATFGSMVSSSPATSNFVAVGAFDRISQSSFSTNESSSANNVGVPHILQRLLSQPAGMLAASTADGSGGGGGGGHHHPPTVIPQPIHLPSPQTPGNVSLSAFSATGDLSNTFSSSNFSRLSLNDMPPFVHHQSESTQQLSPHIQGNDANRPILLTPADLSDGFTNGGGQTPMKTTNFAKFGSWDSNDSVLNQDQFQQAFVYLLQNDGNFLSKLHGAYLASLEQQNSKR